MDSIKHEELTEDQFDDKYRPMDNHIQKSEGFKTYETFGDELDYIMALNDEKPNTIWTIIDGDDGTYYVTGFHHVNRVGYLVTEVPWEHEGIEVKQEDF